MSSSDLLSYSLYSTPQDNQELNCCNLLDNYETLSHPLSHGPSQFCEVEEAGTEIVICELEN